MEALGLGEHGIDERTSVAALARMMLIEDQKVTFVEGTVRRSIGPALAEVGLARDSSGGMAARAQLLGRIGPVNVNAEAILANDFHLQNRELDSRREYRLALDAPLKLGRAVLPAHADVRLSDRRDGTKQLEAAARLTRRRPRLTRYAVSQLGMERTLDLTAARERLGYRPAPTSLAGAETW